MKTWSILVATAVFTLAVGPASAAPSTQRSAASIECSKEADAKGLHGKKRKEFREKCKYDLKKTGGMSTDGMGRRDSQPRDSRGRFTSEDSRQLWGRDSQKGFGRSQ
ncbi:psiF repeat-containing protein [Pseudorhodoplanes sinuspersici]|nr:psiF repeat-containing protein [Pseudorhodoplanes sinuspersici]